MSWRDKLKEFKVVPFDCEAIYNKEMAINGDTLGLKSPTSPATIRISPEGQIDIFANHLLGIRIDPDNDCIQMFGSKIMAFCDIFSTYTGRMDGFMWNTLSLNPGAIIPGAPALFVSKKALEIAQDIFGGAISGRL